VVASAAGDGYATGSAVVVATTGTTAFVAGWLLASQMMAAKPARFPTHDKQG